MTLPTGWQCHVGLESFDLDGGGICRRCHLSTCDLHLRLVDYREADGQAKEDQIACVQCLQAP